MLKKNKGYVNDEIERIDSQMFHGTTVYCQNECTDDQ